MDKKFASFMNNRNSEDKSDIQNIAPKNAEIYNIRRNDLGIYFNIKIDDGYYKKEVNDLFIPSRFYNKVGAFEKTDDIKINKNKLIAYFLIYPGAILSLGIIFAAVFKYLPLLENFLNFSLG